jgi:chromosome segregation ATPase
VSATQTALGAIKTVLTLKEQLDALGRDMAALNARLTSLAEAHGALRDRVSRLEGVLEGAAMAARQRRIEE